MIYLNTYSCPLLMGLIKTKKSWDFLKFVKFLKMNHVYFIEFPIDYFAKKERKNFDYFLKVLKKNKIKFILDLEDFNIKSVIALKKISKIYDISIIRVKMSNFFGGNRFLVKNFYLIKKKFEYKLQKCSQILNNTKIKIAIENHQDLSSAELVNIIKKLNTKNFGINWDMGNSLATAETLKKFFNNIKKYIINVHAKDYKIILSDQGFFLKRTVAGTGVINFDDYIAYFKKKKINISIELAAHISRHCMVKHPLFRKEHKIKNLILKNFIREIDTLSSNENPLSEWQLYRSERKSINNEIFSLIRSYNYIRQIYEKS